MASYLITGCSRGLGLALVNTLVSFPTSDVSTIFATSRGESTALAELVSKHPDRIVTVSLDVLSEESIKAAVHLVEQKLNGKGLDVLINNAGMMGKSPGGVMAMYASNSRNTMVESRTVLIITIGMISSPTSR
jgi:NAD(P)-dependent dehydrogenase (short-subunit alcohol dehydrogenase family)